MSLYLIRHGETAWNKNMIMQGRVDVPLNETGIEQAKIAKKEMESVPIDIAFVSPLIRAKQTASIVLEGRDVPVFEEPRIIEMAYGEFEGISRKEERYWEQKRKFASRYPSGESYIDVGQRVYNFLDEVKSKYRDKNVLMVCHGGIARLTRTYFKDDIENDDFFDTILPNGKPVKFEFVDRNIPFIEEPKRK